jgi:Lsr2
MAQHLTVQLIDDLDGGEATETVRFGLDGKTFQIDLSAKNAAALRKAMAPYVDAGRRGTGGGSASRGGGRSPAAGRGARRGSGAASAKDVREWAAKKGIELASRGRIPSDVIERYRAAGGK